MYWHAIHTHNQIHYIYIYIYILIIYIYVCVCPRQVSDISYRIICPEKEGSTMSLLTIMSKVRLEAFMWVSV